MTDQGWLRTIHLEARAYSNDTLSYEDQIALREILTRAMNNVKSVESDISRLQEAIINLELRRAEGLSHIERLRVGLAPHKRIPPELLSKIFLYCDGPAVKLPPRHHKSIWAVTQVCSKWRRVAMADPLLWRQIKVCNTQKSDALNALLHDIFSHRGGHGAISYDAPWITCPEEWEDVLALVSAYPFRLLDLKISFVGFLPPAFTTPLDVFNNLESIAISLRHLRRHDIEKAPIMAFSTVQNLRKASVHISQRDTKLLSTWPTRISLPWGQLTHLNIDVIPISVFLTILRHCGPLVSCEVRLRDDLRSQEAGENPIELKHLYSLMIRDNTSYSAVEMLLDSLMTPALKSLKFGEEDWDEWPQEFVLSLISRSMCSLEKFETPGRALAEEELLPLMRAMPRLKVFNAFTRQTISQATLEVIMSENLAPELSRLDGWRVASFRSFVELLKSRMTRRNGGVRIVRVWVPGEIFSLEKEYFNSTLPELTKNGRKIRVLTYSQSGDISTSESD